MNGIGPLFEAYESPVLPLNYIDMFQNQKSKSKCKKFTQITKHHNSYNHASKANITFFIIKTNNINSLNSVLIACLYIFYQNHL